MVSDSAHPDGDDDSARSGTDVDPQRRRHDGDDAASVVPASTLMIEIDGFASVSRAKKRSKILDQVSWVVTDTVRGTDAVYRHGESGFCVVLANTPEPEAVGAANRVRANVETMPLLADAGVTVTVGVAAGGEDELAATIERAEQALTGTQGSNQVVRADGDAVDQHE